MADSGARANRGSSARGSSVSSRQNQPPTPRTLALQTDIKKLEAEIQKLGDYALEWREAAQSLIDIAKADMAAGNKSYLGTLAAQQAATHLDKALKQAQNSKSAAPKEALKSSKKARKIIDEADTWLSVHCTLLETGATSQEGADNGSEE